MGDNSTNLARRSTDTECSRTISRGEYFPRDKECSCIRAKILKEIAETVEREDSAGGDSMETKTNDTEEGGQDDEPHDLNGFATDNVDSSDRNPIAWNKTCAREDQIAHTVVVESDVSARTKRINFS